MAGKNVGGISVSVTPELDDRALKVMMEKALRKAEAEAQIEGKLTVDTDDAEKDLKAVGRVAESTGDAIEAAAEQGSDGLSELKKKAKDAQDALDKVGSDAGKSVGDGVRKGTDEAGSGLDDFKSEADGTAREVAASFDGSAESIAGGFQELAANAFAGFGPAGAVAGLAAAAGIGIAVGKMQEIADKTNEATEAAAAFTLEMAKADGEGQVEILADRWDEVASAISDTRKMWEFWQPRAITNAEQFAKAAKYGALNVRDLYDAMTDENPEKRLRGLNGALEGIEKALREAKDAQIGYADGTASTTDLTLDQLKVLRDKEGVMEGAKKTLDDLIKQEEEQAIILGFLAEAQGLTVDEYLKAKKAEEELAPVVQTTTEAYDEATRAAKENLDAKNALNDANRSLYDTETNIGAAVDAVEAALAKNGDTLDEGTVAGRENRDAMSGLASSYDAAADAILAQGGSQADANQKIREGRQAILDQKDALGMTTDEANAYADTLGLIPVTVDTKLQLEQDRAGYADARAKYDGLGRPISTSATVSFDDTYARQRLAAFKELLKIPDVVVTASMRTSGGYYANRGQGSIDMPMARGAVLSNDLATMVPPGTNRIVGDRLDVDEAFIPLDGSTRSWDLLGEARERMPNKKKGKASGSVGQPAINMPITNYIAKEVDADVVAQRIAYRVRSRRV